MCGSASARAGLRRSHGQPDDHDDIEGELRRLARWRTHGGDPDGLGPWPEPTAPNGTVLPRLAFRRRDLRARLEEGRTAAEIHRALHGFAQLVEAKILAVDNWRAPYVFAAFFDGLLLDVRRLDARRSGARPVAAPRSDEREDTSWPSPETMAAVYAESEALRALATVPAVELPRVTARPEDAA